MQNATLIQSAPDAPEGVVSHLSVYTPSTFLPGSTVLCRNTAPLVAFAYALLQRDVPCRILGRDIGAQLISVVKKMRAASLEDFRTKLDVWRDRELTRAEAEGRSPERVLDQHSCLCFFVSSLDEDSRSVDDLVAKIELMFTDDAEGTKGKVTLSTIHKAKGLEYPVVFLLDFHKYLPSRFAKQRWQKEQERNLQYVAVTRSMGSLFYISSGMWKEEKDVR